MQIVARRMEAHLYYQRNREKLHCINCHIFEGHRMEKKLVPRIPEVESAQFPLTPSGFQNYTEAIPGANVKFHMIAVRGGTLQMGSPELGPCRQRDVGMVRDVSLRPFWMAESIVSSRELALFYAQHKGQAKDSNGAALTQQAAKAYTEWLSQATGRKYRLPTEAELEYACLADGTMPAWSRLTSRADMQLPGVAEVNAWGFADMPGSTPEFSVDYPQGLEAAWWSSERIGTSFRVVREPEESGLAKPSQQAMIQPRP
jgi:formylglycine-generating enzyme required for sulfatase activity